MYILNQYGDVLVNSNNVTNFYIKPIILYAESKPSRWEIRAEYPAPNVSNGALFDILASYHNEEDCKENFNNLIHALIEERQFYNFLKEES